MYCDSEIPVNPLPTANAPREEISQGKENVSEEKISPASKLFRFSEDLEDFASRVGESLSPVTIYLPLVHGSQP